MDEEVHRPEMEQSKQKTPIARPMEILPVEGVARSEHRTPRNNEVKREYLEDQKAQILAKMTKKMGGYCRFTNPLDLIMMATQGVSRSPLTEWIIDEAKPKDFVIPTFKQFDGKSNPVDHIFNFQQKMALETRNEAILCKVFSTTLIGPALAQFRQLPEKSIDSFEDLCTQFIKQYNSNRQQQKTMADRHRLVQNEDKTPQQYLERFMEVMNMIYDADSIAAARSFIKGLQPGSMLFEDLIKNTPYDMTKVRVRAQGVFKVLESQEKLSNKVTTISVEKEALEQSKRNYPQSSPGQNKRQKNDRGGYNHQPRQTFKSEVPHYELNASIERIFIETRDKNIFRPLAKIMIPKNMRDKSRYFLPSDEQLQEFVWVDNVYYKKGRIATVFEEKQWNSKDDRVAGAAYYT